MRFGFWFVFACFSTAQRDAIPEPEPQPNGLQFIVEYRFASFSSLHSWQSRREPRTGTVSSLGAGSGSLPSPPCDGAAPESEPEPLLVPILVCRRLLLLPSWRVRAGNPQWGPEPKPFSFRGLFRFGSVSSFGGDANKDQRRNLFGFRFRFWFWCAFVAAVHGRQTIPSHRTGARLPNPEPE